MLYKKLLIVGLNFLVVAGIHAAASSNGTIVGRELPLVRPFKGSALNILSGVIEEHQDMRAYELGTFGYANIQDEIAKYMPKNASSSTAQAEDTINYNDWYREFFLPFVCGSGIFIAGSGYMRYAYSHINWRHLAGLTGASLLGGSLFAAYRTSLLKERFKNQQQDNETARTQEKALLTQITANDNTFIAVHRSLWEGWQLNASSYAGYKSQCHPGIADQTEVYPTPPQCNELTQYIVRDYIPARTRAIIHGSQIDDRERKRTMSGNKVGLRTAAGLGTLCSLGALAAHIKKS